MANKFLFVKGDWLRGALIFMALCHSDFARAQDPSAQPPPSDGQTVNTNVPNPEPKPTVDAPNIFSGLLDSFDYDPKGRRDPFSAPTVAKEMKVGGYHGPVLPLQEYDLNDLRLTGILWNVKDPKALIRDPSGKMHIVAPNSKIGSRNGYVASIREGEIIVVETVEQDGKLVSTAQVVKIAK